MLYIEHKKIIYKKYLFFSPTLYTLINKLVPKSNKSKKRKP